MSANGSYCQGMGALLPLNVAERRAPGPRMSGHRAFSACAGWLAPLADDEVLSQIKSALCNGQAERNVGIGSSGSRALRPATSRGPQVGPPGRQPCWRVGGVIPRVGASAGRSGSGLADHVNMRAIGATLGGMRSLATIRHIDAGRTLDMLGTLAGAACGRVCAYLDVLYAAVGATGVPATGCR